MASRRPTSRRGHHEEEENSERWLLTYADMITLLMAFFIVMYTISLIDLEKFRAMSGSMNAHLSGIGGIGGQTGLNLFGSGAEGNIIPFGHKGKTYGPEVTLKDMVKTLKRNHLDREIRLRKDFRGMIISMLTDGILFEVKSAELKPEAIRALDLIGPILESVDNHLVIEGHSDEQKFVHENTPSINWDLSSLRALNVLKYLVRKNYVQEKRLSLAAFSSFRPIQKAELTQAERMRLSRRVDIVILGTSPLFARGAQTVEELQKELEIGW